MIAGSQSIRRTYCGPASVTLLQQNNLVWDMRTYIAIICVHLAAVSSVWVSEWRLLPHLTCRVIGLDISRTCAKLEKLAECESNGYMLSVLACMPCVWVLPPVYYVRKCVKKLVQQ